MNPKIQQALDLLNRMIADGWEYPDAEDHVSVKLRVSNIALRKAYDADQVRQLNKNISFSERFGSTIKG